MKFKNTFGRRKEPLNKELEGIKNDIRKGNHSLTSKNESRWIPQQGDRYSYIDTSFDELDVKTTINTKEPIDTGRLAVGNYFKTTGEAIFMITKLRIIEELKAYTEPYIQGKEQVVIAHDADGIIIADAPFQDHGTMRFESKKRAQRAINSLDIMNEERLEYYLFNAFDTAEQDA